ncbi:citrate synthase-like protein [Collybia nuda]|uniref:Citrate synthase n=1 Tax=Collybia nuda TaxID=64659 RepID=A0A9P6CIL4_9AGAR|nr:citrate synthase-like protein [Collybia nuda]
MPGQWKDPRVAFFEQLNDVVDTWSWGAGLSERTGKYCEMFLIIRCIGSELFDTSYASSLKARPRIDPSFLMHSISNRLAEAIERRIPSRVKFATELLAKYGKISVYDMTVENVMRGMCGLPSVLWEVSQTNEYGVKYHGKTLEQLDEILPKWPSSSQISPEAVIWFLFTATVPSAEELHDLAADLCDRMQLPDEVIAFCDGLSQDIPCCDQTILVLAVLSRHSKLSAAVELNTPKQQLWRFALEDALDLMARLVSISGRIFMNKFREGQACNITPSRSADLAQNLASMLGRTEDVQFIELIRLYLALHMDHGANASAHTMRLCSSAWTDPYMTASAGLVAGIGALHAGAISRSIRFQENIVSTLRLSASNEQIKAYVVKRLEKHKVIPGFGHALLAHRDPRLSFIERFILQSNLEKGVQGRVAMTQKVNVIVPPLLTSYVPSMRNTAPNVDSMSGTVICSYNIPADFVLQFMTCSRGFGFMTQFVWDKGSIFVPTALGVPLERPKSITMDELMVLVKSQGSITKLPSLLRGCKGCARDSRALYVDSGGGATEDSETRVLFSISKNWAGVLCIIYSSPKDEYGGQPSSTGVLAIQPWTIF